MMRSFGNYTHVLLNKDKVKQLIYDTGWTQSALATEIGISRKTLCHAINAGSMTYLMAYALSAAMNMNVDDLAEGYTWVDHEGKYVIGNADDVYLHLVGGVKHHMRAV